MANPIRQSIALDGASDVQRQFADIADAGQRAFGAIKQAASDAGSGFGWLRGIGQSLADAIGSARSFGGAIGDAAQSLGALPQAFSGFAEAGHQLIEGVGEIRDAAHNAFSSVSQDAAAAAKAIGGASAAASALVSGMVAIGNEGGKAVKALSDVADKSNQSIEQFQRNKFAADSLGLNSDKIAGGFKKVGDEASKAAEKEVTAQAKLRSLQDAASALEASGDSTGNLAKIQSQIDALRNTNPQVFFDNLGHAITVIGNSVAKTGTVFDDFGLSLKGFDGSTEQTAQLVQHMSDVLAKTTDKAQRTKLSDAIRGTFGDDFLDYLKAGNDKINSLGDEFGKLGIQLTDADADIAKQQQTSLARLGDIVDSYKKYIQLLFTPVATGVQDALTGFITSHRDQIVGFVDAIRPAIQWLGDFRNALGSATIGVAGLGAALGLLSPITALGLAGAGAATLAFAKDFQTNIANAFQFVVDEARQAYASIKQQALSSFPSLTGPWNAVENAARQAWQAIVDAATQAFAWLQAHAGEILPALGSLWHALGALVSSVWADIKSAAVQFYAWFNAQAAQGFPAVRNAWNELKTTVQSAYNTISSVLNGIAEGMDRLDQLSNRYLGTNLPTHVTGAQIALVGLATSFLGLNPDIEVVGRTLEVVGGALETFAASITLLRVLVAAVTTPFGLLVIVIGAIVIAVGVLAYKIYTNWDSITSYISDKLQAIKDAAGGVWGWIGDRAKALANTVIGAWQAIKDGFNSVVGFIRDTFNAVIGAIVDEVSALIDKIERAIARLKALVGGGASTATSGDTAGAGTGDGTSVGDAAAAGAFASGGHVRGPGTGTSDSILARVSNGEFVMNARAVAHWGVGAMHALNSAKGYALGGLVSAFAVPSPIPAFAGGGFVERSSATRGRPVVVNIGNQSFPMLANDDVAERLERVSLKQQMTQAGRAPSWVR